MIITTTPSFEGRKITACKGIAGGGAAIGANVVRNLFAGITGIIGGRPGVYGNKLQDARDTALRESEQRAAGADAVAGLELEYEVAGNSMLMASAPAVVLG